MSILKTKSVVCLCVIFSVSIVSSEADDFTNAIREFLQHRSETEKRPGGIVVGLVDERGCNTISYGKLDNDTEEEVNGDTVFGIHSQTCVYTALLLEDMIERGEMKLDDPMTKYLPKAVKMPSYNGKEITLRHLVTETAGFPYYATSFRRIEPKYADNPLAEFTAEKMYDVLSGYHLNSEPGTTFLHGSIAMGLLGHVIAIKSGTNYESLLVDRIFQPLQMDSTRLTMTPELKSRAATEHTSLGYPRPLMDWGALAPLGGLHSTANDLLKFVSANLGFTKSSLTPLLDKHVSHFVWVVPTTNNPPIVQFGGGGMYNTAYSGFDKTQRRGVVVLSTSDDGRYNAFAIGNFLLATCEWKSDRQRINAGINNRISGSCVGQYRPKPNSASHGLWPFSWNEKEAVSTHVIGIRQVKSRIFIQVIGSRSKPLDALLPPGEGELWSDSENRCVERLSGTVVTFSLDAHDKVTGLTLDDHGKALSFEKISDQSPETPKPPKLRVAIKLDAKLLEACTGQYEFPPSSLTPDGMKTKIWREGDHLMGQSWDKNGTVGAIAIYPESETNFFIKLDGSQSSFVRNEKGEVTGLVYRLSGHADIFGRKVSDSQE